MKRVVQYAMDILIRNEEENNLNLEKLIKETLEEKGLYVIAVDFKEDVTEIYNQQFPEIMENY